MNVHEEIKAIADAYLSHVKPSGPENVMAICPFHTKDGGRPERRPSFALNVYTGLWFCHSCQSRGNLYSLLKNLGVNRVYIESVYRPLINAASDNMPPPPDPLRPGVCSSDPIQEGLLGIFDYCPRELLDAGFLENTLQYFGIGFDMDHLRITYPIRDLVGNLVAVSGRDVRGGWPKYKIYTDEYERWGLPKRVNWDRGSVLWNANDVYPRVYFQTLPDFVVVVEGFKACMWVRQAGISNVVALMGDYVTWAQRWILERMGAPVYFFLDNNEAGQVGTEKGIETMKGSMVVKVVEYPERLQQDERAQPDSCTSEEIVQQVAGALSHYEWLAA